MINDASILLVLFLVGAVLFSLIIPFVFLLQSGRARVSTARNLARRFNGSFKSAGWNSAQRFQFEFNSLPVYVNIGTREKRGKTKASLLDVSVRWLDPKTRLIVYPETLPDRLKKFIGLEDIVIGSPDFDKKYIIQGNRETLRQLLTTDAQQAITFLTDSLNLTGSTHVSINDGWLSIRKRVPTQYIELVGERVIREICRIHQLLFEASQVLTGVTFIDPPAIQVVRQTASDSVPRTDPLCMVCGENIENQKVKCRSCKTPHHQDCWQYIGQCSVYGCGQKNYAR